MDIDSILNWVVPTIIFLFLGMVIYGKSKEPIDKALLTIKGWFTTKKEEIKNDSEEYESILTYR